MFINTFFFHDFQLFSKNIKLFFIFNIKPFHNKFEQFPPVRQERVPCDKAIHQRNLMKLSIDVLKTMRLVANAKVVQRGVELLVDWRN
jgi:hypothetical protein